MYTTSTRDLTLCISLRGCCSWSWVRILRVPWGKWCSTLTQTLRGCSPTSDAGHRWRRESRPNAQDHGHLGEVIRIIFDPITRKWRGAGLSMVIRGTASSLMYSRKRQIDTHNAFDDLWINLRPFCPLYFERNAHGLVHLWINFWKLNHSWTILPTP